MNHSEDGRPSGSAEYTDWEVLPDSVSVLRNCGFIRFDDLGQLIIKSEHVERARAIVQMLQGTQKNHFDRVGGPLEGPSQLLQCQVGAADGPQSKAQSDCHILEVDSMFTLPFEKLNDDRNNSKLLVDFVVTAQGVDFPLHRSVIFIRCPYFEVLLSGHFKEKDEKCLKLDDVDVECFGNIVDYLYSGKLCVDTSKVMTLLSTCDYFQLILAREALLTFMIANDTWMTKENVTDVFFSQSDSSIRATKLKIKTSNFIVKHIDDYDDVALAILEFSRKHGVCSSEKLLKIFPKWCANKSKIERHAFLSLIKPAETSTKALTVLDKTLDKDEVHLLFKNSVNQLHDNAFEFCIRPYSDWSVKNRKHRKITEYFRLNNMGLFRLIVMKDKIEELHKSTTFRLDRIIERKDVPKAKVDGKCKCDVMVSWVGKNGAFRKLFSNSVFKFKEGSATAKLHCRKKDAFFTKSFRLFAAGAPFCAEVSLALTIWQS